MTVQEIQEICFEKAVLGGYDMKSVDAFLERVAEDYAALQKENAALKGKMKVLVDKIEEYRGVEDGMRRTLMSAQSIAQDTIEKAKAEAADIVSKAASETETKIATSRERLVLEEQKLAAARKSTAQFIARVSAVYQAQAKALSALGTAEGLAPATPTAPIAQQPAAVSETPVEKAAAPAVEEVPAAEPEPAAAQASPEIPQSDEPLTDATRRFSVTEVALNSSKSADKDFDFGELQFGVDYDPKRVK